MVHSENKLTLNFMLILGAAYALTIPSRGLANQKDAILEAIQRDELLKPVYTYESSISKFARKTQSICIKNTIQKGIPKGSYHAFKWVVDIPDSDSTPTKISSEIENLDALAAVGLLSKERVFHMSDQIPQVLNRYRLTVKGWRESIGRHNGRSCFNLGRAKHLSVMDIKEVEVPIGLDEKESIYKVTAKVGFPKEFKLSDWANDVEVRKAFPLINKLIVGFERTLYMKEYSGQWREYLSPSQLARMEKSGRGRSNRYFTRNKPITKKETMLEAFTFQEYANPTWNCISLPGDSSNGVRVDKKLGSGVDYGVVIFTNKVRAKWDDIEIVTKPHLERLVNVGLLTASEQTGIEGKKRDDGKLFNGTVYRLAPEYKHIVDQRRGCIYMGKGKVEVVNLDVLAVNTWDAVPNRKESAKYKYIMTFPNPPEWAKDRVLQAMWSDLYGALKYGKACEGRGEIDLKEERKMSGRYEACWWAFDSIGEL